MVKITIFKSSILIILFAIALFPRTAKAQCDTDQIQSQWDGGTSERNLPGYYEWESFTAGMTGELCQVDLMFCNSNTQLNGTGILKVYTGTGTGGILLDSQLVVVDGTAYPINTVFWQSWSVDSNPAVAATQVYTFQFTPIQGGGLPDPYLIQINIPNVYAGGHNYNLGTGGCCTFRTYVSTLTSVSKINGQSQNMEILLQDQPTQNVLRGILKTPAEGQMLLEIYDMQGRRLVAKQMNADKGDNPFNFDLKSIESGVYLLRVTGSNCQSVSRFAKL